MLCDACETRGPLDDDRSAPSMCAFDTGVFSLENHRCESLLVLRTHAEEAGARLYMEDHSAATVTFDVEEDFGFLHLGWYKDRGRTDSAVIYTGDGPARPATRPLINAIVSSITTPDQ